MPQATARSKGTVKGFGTEEGWGFITRDDGDELFVHYKAIVGDGFRPWPRASRSSSTSLTTDKGLQASKVSVVG